MVNEKPFEDCNLEEILTRTATLLQYHDMNIQNRRFASMFNEHFTNMREYDVGFTFTPINDYTARVQLRQLGGPIGPARVIKYPQSKDL